ncbi:hypothetical protein ARTHRO9AX_80054 [Arthrobacter sp. 9AX]|nr:hypothetical protein ARTHRO9AX_80054 [Arthrobacter sp. 9AX]
MTSRVQICSRKLTYQNRFHRRIVEDAGIILGFAATHPATNGSLGAHRDCRSTECSID